MHSGTCWVKSLSLCPLLPQLCPLSGLPVFPSPAACKLTSTQALFGLLQPAGCLSGPHGVQWVWRDAGALRALRWLYTQIIEGRRCVGSEGVRPQAPAVKTPEHREAGYSHGKGVDDSSAPSGSCPRGPAWRGWNPGAPTQWPLSGREARPLAAGPWRTALGAPGFQDLTAAARECGSRGRGRGVLRRLGLRFLPRAFSDHAHFDVCVIQSEKKPFTSPSLFLHKAKKQVIVPFSS